MPHPFYYVKRCCIKTNKYVFLINSDIKKPPLKGEGNRRTAVEGLAKCIKSDNYAFCYSPIKILFFTAFCSVWAINRNISSRVPRSSFRVLPRHETANSKCRFYRGLRAFFEQEKSICPPFAHKKFLPTKLL